MEIVDQRGIPVICYGLRADFQGNLFEGSQWLMAWADTIEEIKTVCWCGRKATFNARVSNGRVVKSGEQIMLGGQRELRGAVPQALGGGRARAGGNPPHFGGQAAPIFRCCSMPIRARQEKMN